MTKYLTEVALGAQSIPLTDQEDRAHLGEKVQQQGMGQQWGLGQQQQRDLGWQRDLGQLVTLLLWPGIKER